MIMMYVSYSLPYLVSYKADPCPVDAYVLGCSLIRRALRRTAQTNESTPRKSSHPVRPPRRGSPEPLPPHRLPRVGSASSRELQALRPHAASDQTNPHSDPQPRGPDAAVDALVAGILRFKHRATAADVRPSQRHGALQQQHVRGGQLRRQPGEPGLAERDRLVARAVDRPWRLWRAGLRGCAMELIGLQTCSRS